jgi:DNA-binding NarL/FixJ family response regulator
MSAATVLVVDDQQIMRDVICQMLREGGYDVLSAAGPHQALEIIRGHPPLDLVLSDIGMPGMRGTELVSEVSRISPGTGTVLMAGGGAVVADVPPGIPLLRKPICTRDLLVIVRDVLARSSRARLELSDQREQFCRLRQERMQLRSEFQATARQAAEYLQKSLARPSERAAPNQETKLRQDLVAARAEWQQAAQEFDEFCLDVQARAQGKKTPGRTLALESVAARQRASFERFQRALQALTTFRLAGGRPDSVPALATSGLHVTKRELEILNMLAAGKTTKQTARELNIAFKTVSTHRAHLLQKFEAPNVAMLVSKAIREGYISMAPPSAGPGVTSRLAPPPGGGAKTVP